MMTLQTARRFFTHAAAVTVLGLLGLMPPAQAQTAPVGARIATAIFASGCFWCAEADFSKLEGVLSTTAGYTGGQAENPTYEQVSTQSTGHTESVLVVYDPARISYERLVDFFWHTIDPTSRNRQFCDTGSMHRTGIFALSPEQLKIAQASRAALDLSKRFSKPVVTDIEAAGPFYAAEAYHQHYYKRNPLRYRFYRFNCGRDTKLKELWGDLAVHETPQAIAAPVPAVPASSASAAK
jgi:peptide-methionine (S)-S-oxide reductase